MPPAPDDATRTEALKRPGETVSTEVRFRHADGSWRIMEGFAVNRLNDPSVNGTHGPRKGTFEAASGGCTFSFDRFYRVRGGTEALLPADFSQKQPLASLVPQNVHVFRDMHDAEQWLGMETPVA